MLQKVLSLPIRQSISENNTQIQTTLFDLIEAVNETIKPNEDQLVVDIVMDLLSSGHVKFQDNFFSNRILQGDEFQRN